MKSVLIPTDFSSNAMNAIHYAVQYLKYERCVILFMHAYGDEVYAKGPHLDREQFDDYKQKVATDVETSLTSLLAQLRETSPNPRHRYKQFAVFGSLIDSVSDLVKEKDMDLVIMGTKGHTGDRNITFGSQTLQVLKYVQCPVLAIPEYAAYVKPKKILFPTDYMVPYKRRELKMLHDLCICYRTEIHFLYLSNFDKLSRRQEDNKLFLEGSLPDLDLVFERAYGADRAKTIQQRLSLQDVQMLVMVNSRHSVLESILYHSTIDQLGLDLHVPFLVMQNIPR
ncbi:MAG: universal stress protein [Sediminicola sp.]